jgi:capsular exopolysaccharide synthesis family protein
VARHSQDLDLDPVEPDRGPAGAGLLRIAWNHKSLVALGIAIGLSLGALNYLRKQPVYQSAAQILIINKRPPVTVNGVELQTGGASDDFAAAHLNVIKSRLVVDRTVDKLDVSNYRTFDTLDPITALTDGLAVARDNRDARSSSNAVLNLSFNGPIADECPELLQKIIDNYQGFLKDTYKEDKKMTFGEFKRIKDDLEKQLTESRKARKLFLKDAPLVPAGRDGHTYQHDRLRSAQTQLSELQGKMLQLKTRLDAIDEAIADGRDPAPLLDVSTDSGKLYQADPVASARKEMEDKILQLKLKERDLMQFFGKDNREVQNLQSQIRLIRETFAQNYSAEELKFEDKTDNVKSRIERLRAGLSDYQRQEAALKKKEEEELKALKGLAEYIDREDEYRTEVARIQQQLEGIYKRLPDVGEPKDTPVGGYDAKVLIPPGVALKVEPRAASTLGVALFLGLVLGLGLAWLAEVSDKSFRTPEEIRRRLGLPIVGHIPFLKADADATERARDQGIHLDPLLYTYYHSKSVQSEAYRGVRTALYFSTQGQGSQVIQVTSPNKGDGKSTMAANLAVSIAQSGKRVLVVDGDFRRPRQHQIFGLAGRVGLATVMAGEAELDAAIQPTPVPNLDVLPCGQRPANPAELLTLPRFAELLGVLRSRYDFVIVDTPPLLAVSDPSVVAPRVDGVLLAIRVSKNGRPQAERAKEILAGLGANILGVVVNAVGGRLRDGYENGQYTYGYGYGYAYTYAYEPEDTKSYYDDPESGVDLAGVGRNGNGSAAQANAPTGSNSEIDLGALPGNGAGQSQARRRQRNTPPVSGGASRRPARRGMMNWLRRLWS